MYQVKSVSQMETLRLGFENLKIQFERVKYGFITEKYDSHI